VHSTTPQPPKTTFIPKKTLAKRNVSKSPKYAGLFSTGAILLLILSVVGYSGLFLYKTYLEQLVDDLAISLERAKGAFDPTLIEELKRVDMRLSGANGVLTGHVVLSPLFKLFEQNTLKTVRYSQMNFVAQEDGTYRITMEGEADDYAAIALQSDIFSDNQHIKDHIFSNLSLNSRSNISFKFTALVEPEFLQYISHLVSG